MEERPLERARRAALEERPWEPAGGWDAHLRGRRIRLVRQSVLDLVAGSALILGAAFRDEVTERAEEIRSMSSVGLVGWPLLAVVCLAIAALVVSQRRARWARRWLADPLPRS